MYSTDYNTDREYMHASSCSLMVLMCVLTKLDCMKKDWKLRDTMQHSQQLPYCYCMCKYVCTYVLQVRQVIRCVCCGQIVIFNLVSIGTLRSLL